MLSWLGRFLSSSIGKKTLMALTGLMLVGFLLAHLAGNLTLYAGDEAFNGYAHKLESYGLLLNVAEVGLLALFVVHVVLALRVSRENAGARPNGYRSRATFGKSTVASRSMLVTGLVVGLFVVIHVIDFRVPKLLGKPELDDLAVAVRRRLASPLGAGIYLVGVVALGMHLSHGFRSALQTLGANHPRYDGLIRGVGLALATLILLGFASFPVILFVTGGGSH
jgi:succinate dehydrogenase / fumarate reductase cytochrome b subunit